MFTEKSYEIHFSSFLPRVLADGKKEMKIKNTIWCFETL